MAEKCRLPVALIAVTSFLSILILFLLIASDLAILDLVVTYLVAASLASGIATYLLARRLAATVYRAAELLRQNLEQQACVEPRVLTSYALLLHSAAGFEQVGAMWPLVTASAGIAGIYILVTSYYLLWRSIAAFREACNADNMASYPSVAAIAAALLASLGLAGVLLAPLYSRACRLLDSCGVQHDGQMQDEANTSTPSINSIPLRPS
ncbi:hypothetical protein [Hyperthermus butylicus]|uniref:Uncharacterized protein n=1 Tax=Hyperthermus butylicus (strain DSM 5456 / JCM 9403 / PLM1-5) TaxID=415426 RepID=A2BN09_HYPBU|nr:hypothetical protein [Hyperthermus butylicus]ABM81370.1 hypothetical protein Hbut_1549 [Hyperthermus butylicus DSM 5456]